MIAHIQLPLISKEQILTHHLRSRPIPQLNYPLNLTFHQPLRASATPVWQTLFTKLQRKYQAKYLPTTYCRLTEGETLSLCTSNIADNTPASYIQAINSASSTFWKKALEKEITNMYEHDVWVIVQKSGEQNRLNCIWVFKIKRNQLNVPTKYKARMCVKGFQQVKGTDYDITYALTGKLVSL